jgi:hypothetical protein
MLGMGLVYLVWSVRGNRLELLYGGTHEEGNVGRIANAMSVYKWNVPVKERKQVSTIAQVSLCSTKH